MRWWSEILPTEDPPPRPLEDRLELPRPGNPDRMLVRQRVSRIYYLRSFFDYPVKLDLSTMKGLGPVRMGRIGLSYLKSSLRPRREERSLEDFMINRFGEELYQTFFRDYTEKVWGVPCSQIKPEWGAQRIKGLSVARALRHSLRSLLPRTWGIEQKAVETSLIERFLYPKYGPGQLWEEVARRIEARGGQVLRQHRVTNLRCRDGHVREVVAIDERTGQSSTFSADYFFSTMPVNELVAALAEVAPADVERVARGLEYRDFIAAGLLVPRLKLENTTRIPTRNGLVPDNWIYVQEKEVKLGRLQLFQNWSPYMVADPDRVWIGLEYFCQQGDELWRQSDSDFLTMAARELASIGIIEPSDVLDGTVVRVEKTYPAYFGTYDEFSRVRAFTDTIPNLYLIGRNGMHRYNNADHSMLTAMTAVDLLLAQDPAKEPIWSVNTEQDYHEQK